MELTLLSMCGGAVQEKVNRELHKVADNILDPNTDSKAKREVNIKIVLAPREDNPEDVAVDVVVTSKIAPELGVGTQLWLEKDLATKKVQITEYERGQIRGQLNLGDVGIMPVQQHQESEEKVENPTEPIDFRKIAD